MQRPKGVAAAVTMYRRKAESKVVLDMAAKLWVQGVAFKEALDIAKRAQKRILERTRGSKGKGRGKG